MFYSFLQFPSALFSSILMYGGKALRGAGGGGDAMQQSLYACLFVCQRGLKRVANERALGDDRQRPKSLNFGQ